MADAARTLGTLALAVAGAIGVPIVLGSLYTTWTQVQPAPREVRAAPARQAPVEPAVAPPEPEVPERPMWPREIDGEVFGRLEGTLTSGTEARDVAPEAPFRLDLSRKNDRGSVDAASLDLDRDGKWDERWSFRDGEVVRETSPADDGRYTEKHRLADGDWVKVEPPVGG